MSGGGSIKLSTLQGAPLVLYFYPQADTPGCTIESKGFRDSYGEFRAKNVQILGVSTDEVDEQDAFKGKYALPFPLVADSSKAVARLYGVLGSGGRARRVTFLLDSRGKILEIVDDPKAPPHVERARKQFLTS